MLGEASVCGGTVFDTMASFRSSYLFNISPLNQCKSTMTKNAVFKVNYIDNSQVFSTTFSLQKCGYIGTLTLFPVMN